MKDKLYIGGKWLEPNSQETIAIINPATEATITHVPAGNAADIDTAVKAARHAFDHSPWSSISGSERAVYLRRFAKKITENLDEIAKLETQNNGKPYPEAQWDVEDSAGTFEYYAGLAEEFDANNLIHLSLPDERFKSKVIKEPVGVIGAIIPWNYPLLLAAWKVAPALAAGCTVVLKPSEVTPLTAQVLAEIAEQIELPAGVLNVVTGNGPEAGRALSEHPGVDKLAFTGSGPTGAKIMKAASKDAKNLSLELGGKSPFIVFADSDIEKAVEWIMFGIFWNQGQVCSATSRVLVEESLYPALTSRLIKEAKKITIGPGDQDGVMLGPLVNDTQYRKVTAAVERAVQEGATLAVGGKRPANLDSGYFLEPTI